MKKLTLVLAALSFLHSAQAEVAEANVTVQFKLITKTPETVQGKYTVENLTTATYKTANLMTTQTLPRP